MNLFETVFVQPWPAWIAGGAIGAFVIAFGALANRALGVSSGFAEACNLARAAGPERWKLWFVLGLPLGGLASAWASGTLGVDTSMMPLAQAGLTTTEQALVLALGGVLIGFGARTAGGCTSGHSIVGIAQGARSSLVATIGFMAGGFAATWLLHAWIGGNP